MKTLAYEIVDSFHHLTIPDSHQREVKALAVAQALAYSVALDCNRSVEEQCDAYEGDLKRLVGEINERTPVDIRLCRSYFKSLLKVRYELLTGVESSTLIRFLIKSDLQAQHLTEDEAQLFRAFVKDRGFSKFQRDVSGLTVGVLQEEEVVSPETPPEDTVANAVAPEVSETDEATQSVEEGTRDV